MQAPQGTEFCLFPVGPSVLKEAGVLGWLSIRIPDISEITVKMARPQSAFPGLLGGRTSRVTRVTVAALDTSLTGTDLFTDQHRQLKDTFLEHLNLRLRENTRLKLLYSAVSLI